MRPWQRLGGEELRRMSKHADNALDREIMRLRAADPVFRATLKHAMDLDDEKEARKSR